MSMKQKSETHGTPISSVEVTNVSPNGLWILLQDKEWFLPFKDFPWFREAAIGKVMNVQALSADHFYWPDLDIDLDLESIAHPERFPLVSGAKFQ
ncbi:MAG: DUF2442 domain-containing protein [Planctomycetota bacterium]